MRRKALFSAARTAEMRFRWVKLRNGDAGGDNNQLLESPSFSRFHR
ncbi:hypothetical protein [Yaniella flava]